MPSMTVDPAEVAQFDALSTEWWNPKGPFAPLHRFTPVRMDYFRSRLTRHFGLPRDGARPLAGLRVLDIGCGGGLIAEPLHRLGAAVTAIDAAAGAVDAARAHAALHDLTIDYRCLTAEALAAEGARFDVVVAKNAPSGFNKLATAAQKACRLATCSSTSEATTTSKRAPSAWSPASPRAPRKARRRRYPPISTRASRRRPNRHVNSTPMARPLKSAAATAPSQPVSAIGNATAAAPIFKPGV